MTSNPYFNSIQTSLKPSSTGFSFSSPKLLFPNSPRIFPISRPAIQLKIGLCHAQGRDLWYNDAVPRNEEQAMRLTSSTGKLTE